MMPRLYTFLRPSNLFSRNAYNFTAALYDAGSETLYYYELDT